MLDKHDLGKLQEILKQEFGYSHDDKEAQEIGQRLISLYQLLTQPSPQAALDASVIKQRAAAYLHYEIVHCGNSPSVREFSRAMTFGSARSGHQLLKELMNSGIVTRTDEGELRLKPDFAQCKSWVALIAKLANVLRRRAGQR